MTNVMNVAEFMISSAGDESDITNLKLNKPLYFAQGTHFARTGQPLFEDDIVAWAYGPVVVPVYERYKANGNGVISPDSCRSDYDGLFTSDEVDSIIDTIVAYDKYSASYLVNRTHAPGTPWCETPKNQVIPKSLLQQFFSKRDAAPRFQLDLSRIDFIGRRDASGALVLPAEEDDGEDWSEYDEV